MATALALLAQYSYPAMFILLVASGMGAPLSEDLILLGTGGLVARGLAHPGPAIAVCYAGLLVGDLTLFTIGRKLGKKAMGSKRLSRVFSPERRASVEQRLAKWGPLAIFGARFVPGARAATFACSGALGVPVKRFFFADAIAGAIWVPAVVIAGQAFLPALVAHPLRVVGVVAALAVVILIVRQIVKKVQARGAFVAAEHELEDAGR